MRFVLCCEHLLKLKKVNIEIVLITKARLTIRQSCCRATNRYGVGFNSFVEPFCSEIPPIELILVDWLEIPLCTCLGTN